MTSSLIGITGYLQTGKDSVARMLADFGYTKLAFADPLRQMALAVDPVILLAGAPQDVKDALRVTKQQPGRPVATLSSPVAVRYSVLLSTVGYERAKSVPDFRRFLQRLGTQGVRDVLGDLTWINAGMFCAQRVLRDGGKVVFSDVRFLNEAAAVRDAGGEVWRTVRPGYAGGDHRSETELDEIIPDLVLEADDLDQLGFCVLQALGEEFDAAKITEWKEAILG